MMSKIATNTAVVTEDRSHLSRSLRYFTLGMVVLSGCEKQPTDSQRYADAPQPEVAQSARLPELTNFDPNTITSKGKPIIEQLDPSTVLQKNEGYMADMNGDGILDHTILDGKKIYFSKGLGNDRWGEKIQIAELDDPVFAYRIGTLPERGILTPSLIFYDFNHNGYVQENRGARPDGSPILLDPESVNSAEDFNF